MIPRCPVMDGLFAALCLGRNRLFLMLASYADETGSSPDPRRGFVGMGGLVADANAWGAFNGDWLAICEEEGITPPFHMTDFAANSEQFDEPAWREKSKQHRTMGRLLAAIQRVQPIPIGAVVSVADFNGLTEDQRRGLGGDQADPYYVAFQECTFQMVFAGVLSRFPAESISMVYAKLKKFTGRAEGWWHAVKEHNPLLGNYMSSYTCGEPADYCPLQAADLWAYELGRHFEAPRHFPWRYPFQELVKMAIARGYPFMTYFDRREMLKRLGEAE